MKNNEQVKTITTSSFPTFTILGIIFITLKLCHVIDWSWIWVLVPFWGPLAIVMAIAIVFLVVMAFLGVISFFLEK
jgi:hypothetical protein